MQQISSDNNNKCGSFEPMLLCVSSDERPARDELSEHSHGLIMCTDVKGGH